MEKPLVIKLQLILMFLGYALCQLSLPPCETDNLLCASSELCFSREMLCNGESDCADGSDEGVNATSFNCTGGVQCSPEMSVPVHVLCDGVANCGNGEDETSVVCADKCLGPFHGGCAALNQTCTTEGSNVTCLPCPPEFDYIPSSGTCGAIVLVEFERGSYVVNEGDGTVEVCLVLIGELFRDISVDIFIMNISAVDAVDFQVVTPTVTFTENRTCTEIEVTDDNIALEEAENVSLTFSVPPGVEKGNISASAVIITDDDVLTVQFTAETFVIDDSGTVSVCLRTNTGIAVDLDVVLILFLEVEPNGNTTFTPVIDTISFQQSSQDGIECTSFFNLMNLTDDDILIVVFDLPLNSDAQKGVINESMVVVLEDEDETSRTTEAPTTVVNSTNTAQSDITGTAVGSVFGAVFLTLVILSVVFIVYCVRRKTKQHKVQQIGSPEAHEMHNVCQEVSCTTSVRYSGTHEMHSVLQDNSCTTTSVRYYDVPGDTPQNPRLARGTSHYVKPMTEAKLLIPGRHIQLLDSIGKGEFGMVYRARLTGWEGMNEVVAVKTMRGMMLTPSDVEDMMKESLKMKDFENPNVLNLIGVSIDAGDSPHIVMPYMANGSLLSFLKKERPNLTIGEDADDEMATAAKKTLLSMCLQIAKGMEYLARQRIVHRDLAARNCMMDMNHVIKVADFGLSESMYSKNYFREGKSERVKLPVKWMAIESFQDGIFTEKTDVWSFGVTCWEVFSLGKSPYPGVDPFTLVKALESGMRLETPSNAACSSDVYDNVMFHCWDRNPENRPTFIALVATISALLEGIAGYMEFSVMSLSEEVSNDSQVEGTTAEPSSPTSQASLKTFDENKGV